MFGNSKILLGNLNGEELQVKDGLDWGSPLGISQLFLRMNGRGTDQGSYWDQYCQGGQVVVSGAVAGLNFGRSNRNRKATWREARNDGLIRFRTD